MLFSLKADKEKVRVANPNPNKINPILSKRCMDSIAYSEIDHSYYSSATSIMSTLQQFAQSFGVAFAAILLQFFSSYQLVISIQSLHYTFIAMGIVTLFSMLVFINLRKKDGAELLN